MYFLEHKLAVQVDEKGHTDRDEKKKENEREEQIKKEIGCIFIRINPVQKIIFLFRLVKYSFTLLNQIKKN